MVPDAKAVLTWIRPSTNIATRHTATITEKTDLFSALPANIVTREARHQFWRQRLPASCRSRGRRYPLSSRSSSAQGVLGRSLDARQQAIAAWHGCAEGHGTSPWGSRGRAEPENVGTRG